MERSVLRSAALGAVFAAGLTAAPSIAQLWEPGNRLLLPTSGDEAAAEFGHTLAVGDFDGDGLDDLAVASPFRDVAQLGLDDAGEVEILLARPGRTFVSDLRVVGGHDGGWFGWALATGDFDGDGDDELAIGEPRSDAGADFAGAVLVLDLADVGWTAQGAFRQGLDGLPGTPEIDDEFGFTLAAGDFDDDGFDDLAVGVPLEGVTGTDEGAVEVIYGSATGLTGAGSQLFAAGQGGVLGTPGDGDTFGWSLAVADFDADGFADLAIGAPRRNVGALVDAGQVHVLRGGAAGLSATNDLLLDGVAGDPGAGQGRFGFALAAGDFNYPGIVTCIVTSACAPDLAVGSPTHVAGGDAGAGRVTVLFSTPGAGPSTAGALVLEQDDLGETIDAGDELGGVLAAGRLDRGSFLFDPRDAADLLLGVPYEDSAAGASTGVAHLLFGGPSGPATYGVQTLRVRSGLIAAPAQAQDKFGAALASGDFDGDGWGDLAIGLARRDRPGALAAGAVQIQYGALFGDGCESAATCGWSTAGCP
ncbi:MAG: hypothetical protein AMXMBFR36_12800 [Acidobacteriota bacterium]